MFAAYQQVLLDDMYMRNERQRNQRNGMKENNISQNQIAVSLVLLGYPEVKRTRDQEPA
jgi:hypothetical protein